MKSILLAIFILLTFTANAQISTIEPKSSGISLDKIEFVSFNFGKVPYGKNIIDYANYSSDDYNSCLEYGSNVVVSPIWIVDEGICFAFVQTLVAQEAGIKLLIIIHDNDEDISQVHFTDFIDRQQIKIMAILIKKHDGEQIKSYIKDKQSQDPQYRPHLLIHFPELKTQQRVLVEYWFSGIDHSTYSFFEHFEKIHSSLSSTYVEFIPHVILYTDSYSQRIRFSKKNDKCVSGGRYCSLDPDGTGPLIGRDQVIQNLRSLCVYSLNPESFLDYMIQIDKQCIQPQSGESVSYFDDCADIVKSQVLNITKEEGYSRKDKIEKCIDSSFYNKDKDIADNNILKLELQKYNEYQVNQWPALYINQQNIGGDLTDYDMILTSVCGGLSNKNSFQICQAEVGKQEMSGTFGKVSTVGLITLIIVICLIIIILFLIYLKRQSRKDNQQQLQKQVQDAVTSYIQLANQAK